MQRIQKDMSLAVGIASFLKCSYAVLSIDIHQRIALKTCTDVQGRDRGCQMMASPIPIRSRGSI